MDNFERLISIFPQVIFPKRVFIGNSAFKILSTFKGKILVITSPSVSQHYQNVLDQIQTKEIVFCSFEPTYEQYLEIKEKMHSKIDFCIGFGGGGVMDMAKLIKKDTGSKLILIPTTFGSGSESSQYALLVKDGQKLIFSGEEYLSDYVFLNPDFLNTLNKEQVFYNVVDALAHSIEGLVSKKSNSLTDILAIEALDYLVSGADNYLNGDEESLKDLQMGGFLAGVVQSSASVGSIHALAHFYGAKLGIPHGQAIALFLLDVLEINIKGSEAFDKLSNSKTLSKATLIKKIKNLYKQFNIKLPSIIKNSTNLDEDIAKISTDICARTNPIMISKDEYRRIISNHYE